MEERIKQLQSKNQVLRVLQNSITETINELNHEMTQTTVNNLSQAFFALEGERITTQQEITRLQQL
jgi:hypothetical protein